MTVNENLPKPKTTNRRLPHDAASRLHALRVLGPLGPQHARVARTGRRSRAQSRTHHDDNVTYLHAAPDGAVFITGGTNSLVNVWEMFKKGDARLKASLAGHEDTVTCVQCGAQ